MRKQIIYLSITLASSILLSQSCSENRESEIDVLVVGGSTSGISAGIQSARLGIPTIIVEETEWLGGMITAGGVSGIDGNHFLHSGIWNDFRRRLRTRYGGEMALATGWVSNTLFEPHIGDSIFKSMAAETDNLKVIYGYHLISILKKGNRVSGAVFENESKEN